MLSEMMETKVVLASTTNMAVEYANQLAQAEMDAQRQYEQEITLVREQASEYYSHAYQSHRVAEAFQQHMQFMSEDNALKIRNVEAASEFSEMRLLRQEHFMSEWQSQMNNTLADAKARVAGYAAKFEDFLALCLCSLF